jgi:preprotein translocase subunit SecE
MELVIDFIAVIVLAAIMAAFIFGMSGAQPYYSYY